ncbi:hypothetical protein C0J52_27340 [Blattella germanica]|nr:hypothetical protein C0J52_27340 [Blattella germanica]
MMFGGVESGSTRHLTIVDFKRNQKQVMMGKLRKQYHSVKSENIPSTSCRKGDVISWVQSKNIAYSEDLNNVKLLELVKSYEISLEVCGQQRGSKNAEIIVPIEEISSVPGPSKKKKIERKKEATLRPLQGHH